jgi:ElaA protein
MTYRWQTTDFDGLESAHLYAALRLRQQVFAVEQDCAYLDLDNLDQEAAHMLCWRGQELLAYQRCLPPGLSYPQSALGRIVVSAPARGQQLGKELVRRGIAHNLERWPGKGICLNAQAYLKVFYEDLGFIADGGEYDLDSIPHIKMVYGASA